MSNELEPCPFCGGEYAQVRYMGGKWQEPSAFDSGYRGECCDCGAITAACDSKAEAIAAWNTRASVEYDGWFYLPKPKESIVQYGEQRTEKTEHGYKVTQPVEVIESAIRSWGDELGEYIMKRICEAWSTRFAPGSGTCVITPIVPNSDMGRCSACGQIADVASNYCWRCGAKAVKR